jgi:hypothetical protein
VRKDLKKISAVFLLLLTALPSFYSLSLQIRQKAVHRQMKKELEEKMLCRINLAGRNYYWIEDQKEINIDGRLFDIKRVIRGNGNISVIGLYDQEETALVQQLEKNQEHNSRDYKQFALLLQLPLMIPDSFPNDPGNPNLKNKPEFPVTEQAPVTTVKLILTPPPQA